MSLDAVKAILEHSKTKGADQLILIRIAWHINDLKDSYTWVSLKTISDETGYHYNHINNRVLVMEKNGELIIERKTGFTHHFYVAVWKRPSTLQGYPTTPSTPVQCGGGTHYSGEGVHTTVGTIKEDKEKEDKKESDSLRSSGVASFNQGIGEDATSSPNNTLPANSPPHVSNGMPSPKKEKSPRAHLRKHTYTDPRFETFWTAYPNKTLKGAAEKAWNKLQPNDELVVAIMAKLAEAIKSDKWQKDCGAYIPNPTRWLIGRGWLDDFTPIKRVRKLVL